MKTSKEATICRPKMVTFLHNLAEGSDILCNHRRILREPWAFLSRFERWRTQPSFEMWKLDGQCEPCLCRLKVRHCRATDFQRARMRVQNEGASGDMYENKGCEEPDSPYPAILEKNKGKPLAGPL